MKDVRDGQVELGWLSERPEQEGLTGYDPDGWEASTWVLHAMYENPRLPSDVSHHEFRQQAISEGSIEPLIVGGMNLDEMTTNTGTTTGHAPRPGSDGRRLRWRELADRLGFAIGSTGQVAPCFRWFPIESWPLSITAPPEGSLDEASLAALVPILAAHSPSGLRTSCVAFYGSVAVGAYDAPVVLRGRMEAIPTLVEHRSRFHSTPSNFWPVDRSWFVWTDWDLWATKISGTASLIAEICDSQDLETINWRRDND